MLNILLSLTVFLAGYLILTRRISQLSNTTHDHQGNKNSHINENCRLDHAIMMFLTWIIAFSLFCLLLITTHAGEVVHGGAQVWKAVIQLVISFMLSIVGLI